jgi:hypothetical protein
MLPQMTIIVKNAYVSASACLGGFRCGRCNCPDFSAWFGRFRLGWAVALGLAELVRNGRHRLRLDTVIAVQGGVAAGVAWYIAAQVLDHTRPFFAPISAVVVLGGAAGQRWRRALELVFGVALGIALGDLLIFFIGVGVWQIALVVGLAILLASFLGGATLTVNQAAASAVLVATLAPPRGGIYSGRIVDAIVGGLTALAVMALVVPFNPLTRVRRSADGELDALVRALIQARDALAGAGLEPATEALGRLRGIEGEHLRLRASLAAGRETAALAPLRWRFRPALGRYVEAEVHIERAIRNCRVLLRRVISVVRNSEPAPPALARSLSVLAEAVTSLREELAARDPAVGPGLRVRPAPRMAGGDEVRQTRDLLVAAVVAGGLAYQAGVGFSGSVVVAQVRSAVVDLLQATGLDEPTAIDTVRQAVPPPGPS